jgi:hypothetical protein
MDDVLCVKIFHAAGDLDCPISELLEADQIVAVQDVVQTAAAQFGHDTWRILTNTTERYNKPRI